MSQDSIIARMLAKQAAYAEQKASETPTVKVERGTNKAPKSTKGDKAPKATKGEKSEKGETPAGFMPTIVGRKEAIDAETFLQRMRTVRFVTAEGRHGSRSPDRGEKVQTIADFMGSYVESEGDAYGTIEFRAFTEARRQRGLVVPGEDRREVRSAQASLSGFVSGVCDEKGKLIASLKGREREAVDALCIANRDGDEDAAAIESARLKSIRADLARIGC